MTANEIEEIERAAKKARTERIGLYLMVWLILMQSCGTSSVTQRIEAKITDIQPCATANPPAH